MKNSFSWCGKCKLCCKHIMNSHLVIIPKEFKGVLFTFSPFFRGPGKLIPQFLRVSQEKKVPWLTSQVITQFANYTAVLPVTLRKRHVEMGFLCLWGRSSSSPGRAPELWTPAHTTAGLRRSLGPWASDLSLYRLIPRQSSAAAVWAMTRWKPIKCSWAYFGSGRARGSHSWSRAGHCAGLTTRGHLVLWWVQGSGHHYCSWYSVRIEDKFRGKLCLDAR